MFKVALVSDNDFRYQEESRLDIIFFIEDQSALFKLAVRLYISVFIGSAHNVGRGKDNVDGTGNYMCVALG